MMYWHKIIMIVVVGVVVAGCMSSSRVSFRDTDPTGWRRGEGVVVTVPNSDSLSLCIINFVFKVDPTFCYDSIPMLIKIEAPDSTSVIERLTLHTYPAPETGITRYRELVLPYRIGAQLSQCGDYKFVIDSQLDDVRGVIGVGVTIEPSR